MLKQVDKLVTQVALPVSHLALALIALFWLRTVYQDV